MDALVSFLFFCQALGALGGVFAAVWGEVSYIRAIRAGHLDRAERAHLDAIAKGLRFGMSLLLLASFGLVIVAYAAQTSPQPALTANYWILIALAVLVIGVSWALSRKSISFGLGSALVFTAWLFLSSLALGWMPAFSFGAAVAFYAVAAAIFFALLHYVRLLCRPRS